MNKYTLPRYLISEFGLKSWQSRQGSEGLSETAQILGMQLSVMVTGGSVLKCLLLQIPSQQQASLLFQRLRQVAFKKRGQAMEMGPIMILRDHT